jgi:hypothetical protein
VAGVAAGFGIMNDEQEITIGEGEGWGQSRRFGISAADQRQHIYIIGKTGSGKTTLVRNLIIQHIALGHGVGVIDPHGDLAEELLNHIPPDRADHLVYFNPGDIECPSWCARDSFDFPSLPESEAHSHTPPVPIGSSMFRDVDLAR